MVVGNALNKPRGCGARVIETPRKSNRNQKLDQGSANFRRKSHPTGGKRDGTVYYPTVLADVQDEMKVVAEEALRTPVASIISSDDFESALKQANNTKFGVYVSTKSNQPRVQQYASV